NLRFRGPRRLADGSAVPPRCRISRHRPAWNGWLRDRRTPPRATRVITYRARGYHWIRPRRRSSPLTRGRHRPPSHQASLSRDAAESVEFAIGGADTIQSNRQVIVPAGLECLFRGEVHARGIGAASGAGIAPALPSQIRADASAAREIGQG